MTIATQIIMDGTRNAVVKIVGTLTAADQPQTTIVNASALAFAPPLLNIMHVDYSISDGLEVQLLWNATSDVLIMPLAGRGRMSFVDFGGLPNNAGAGVTGNIDLQTTGGAASGSVQLIYTIILEMTKKGLPGYKFQS
jgi:hypothetical protein